MSSVRRSQAERSAATREALLDATIDCLVEEGYASITTSRVSERAGLSRGAHLHHFHERSGARQVATAAGAGRFAVMPPTVHVAPEPAAEVEAAVREAGGEVAPLNVADGLVWVDPSPDAFPDELPDGVRWVQLPSAGVERWLDRIDRERQWATAAPAFGRPVAEHALALMLAGTRRLHEFARARAWQRPEIHELAGATVALVGAGAIGRALIELLEPFRVELLAVTRSGRDGTLQLVERLGEVLPRAGFVVIAAPTPRTHAT